MWAKQKLNGFTIVELLIVIVVIGILAAITIVAYGSLQQKARDNTRKTEVNSLAKALEMYYAKHGNFTQPENLCTDSSFGGMGTCGASGVDGDWDVNSDLRDLVTDGFINKLPIDPINDATFKYFYEPSNVASNGADAYSICARLEVPATNYCLSATK